MATVTRITVKRNGSYGKCDAYADGGYSRKCGKPATTDRKVDGKRQLRCPDHV